MKVLIVSKALVSAAYRTKLAEMARLGVEVVAVIPAEWKEGSGQKYESADDSSYRVILTELRWNGRFHFHYYPALPAILREVRPDLVHIDEEPYNLATFLGSLAARRARIPSIFFTWQNILRRYPPPFRQMEEYVYHTSAHAIAGNHDAADVLHAKGFSKNVSVVPQFGVDPDVFRPRCPPSGPFTVGYFNRLVPGKAPLIALRALHDLPGDVRLLMVGDGPLRRDVVREVAALRLGDRVLLRPRVASAEIPGLLAGVHVSVLASISTPTWKEQFGRVLVEAMSAGIPVIGSDSGEIPTVIGDAGLVVPAGDAPSLAAAIRRLYEETELRADLGRRGRSRALALYSQAHIARETVSVYRRVLAQASL